MTIKAQLRGLLVVVGLLFVFMFGMVVQSSRVNERYQARGLVLTHVIREVFDFNIAAGDYLLNHQDRPMHQMELALGSIAQSLGEIKLERADRLLVLADLQRSFERARQLFLKLKDSHEAFHAKYGVDISADIDPFVHQQIEDLSLSLSISSHALVTSAHYLLKSSDERQAEALRSYDRMVQGGLAVSFVLLTLSVLFFSRRFVHSIAALKEGAARISAGNLTSRIEMIGRDEWTDLSQSINDMADKLRASYEAQEGEIQERKLSEASLLASDQQLRLNETRIQELNKDLENQLVKLREANREMESFTYSVSHDLRAPVRHISGFVELLCKKDLQGLDEKSRHYLKVVSEAAEKMGCLIDDLLSFSRMGRGEMMNRSVDLQQLAQEVIEEISRDLPPIRTIQWRVGDLPVVTGDRAMLRLVLVNLIANAVKYSDRVEAPVIEVDALPPGNNGHTLYVRDNGAGFDMKYVDKLFGLFQRLHSSEEYEGTGVGLANVRRIIGRHGGRTWAEGELNKGATFYFMLPQT